MVISELVQLFRQYVDEPDQTYLSDTDVSTYLTAGYREFRNMVSDNDPFIYSTKVRCEVINETSVETIQNNFTTLAGVLVPLEGATVPFASKMVRLTRIYRPISDDVTTDEFHDDIFELTAVTERKALNSTYNSFWLGSDARIYFSTRPGSRLVIEYVVDFDPVIFNAPFNPVFFDRFDQFHDVIALLAAQHYAIREQAANPVLQSRLQVRAMAMREYFLRRNFDGPHYVNRVNKNIYGN